MTAKDQIGDQTKLSVNAESQNRSDSLFGVMAPGASVSAAAHYEAGRALLQAAGCTRSLANDLISKPDGRPYTPVQLYALGKDAQPAALAQLMAYLASPQPAGGYESLLSLNRDAARERVEQAIFERLMGAGGDLSYAALIKETREAAREEKSAVDVSEIALNERKEKAEEVLARYHQEAARSQGGQGGLFEALKKMVGGYVKLTEAVRAFNERENTTLSLAAHIAASQVLAGVMSLCDRLLGGIETTRAAAVSCEAQAFERERLLTQASAARGRAADYVVSCGDVVDVLCREDDEAAHLPELMSLAREGGPEAIAEGARIIAERITQRRLTSSGIVDLIQHEAERYAVGEGQSETGAAPLMVGMRLLDLTRRARPGARLAVNARPADFILQICPGETPLFFNAHLIAAHLRKSADEFAFMRVLTDLSIEDLQVCVEGRSDFDHALERREFFVLEDLVEEERVARARTRSPQTAEGDEALYQERSPNGSVR